MANGYTWKDRGAQSAPCEITELNSQETKCITYLAGLDSQLREHEKHMEDRLKRIPNAWRDYRLTMTLIAKVMHVVYATMPSKTLRRFVRLSEFGEVVIRPRPAATAHAYVQIVEEEDLKYLVNRVIEGECAMCLKRGGEAKACPLRSALLHVAAPDEIPADGTCPYQYAVRKCELGEYI